MTWVKFEHDTALNRKVAPVSDQAFRAWFRMIGWSVGAGTDGVIGDAIPRELFTPSRRPKAIIEELFGAGLLDRVEGGFQIHDFADYQLSGAEQKKAKEDAARRKRDERARRRNGSTPSSINSEPEP